MKTKFFIAAATVMTLFFTSCKKSEILTEEVITTEKSLTSNVLEGSNWEVLSVVSVPKNVNISWTVNHPKFTFGSDFIEMKLGRNICSKNYSFDSDNITVDFTSCTITNQNHQLLSDLMEGDFQYIISDSGDEMILKNNLETEVILRKINQLGASTPVVSYVPFNL